MKRLIIGLLVLAAAGTLIYIFYPRQNSTAIAPVKKMSVVIVGNTFAERLQHYNYFEPLLFKSFETDSIVVKNLAWSGDAVDIQLRPLGFGTTDDWIAKANPDIIIACFGMNESFEGRDSLEVFGEQLTARAKKYKALMNTRAPQLIFLSPIAHEQLKGKFADPSEHNSNLELYTEKIKKIAGKEGFSFIDLFHPTKSMMEQAKSPLTINGIHLNDEGYKLVGELMARQLNLPVKQWSDNYAELKQVIDLKNRQFFYRYRAVNGEYIYGRRKEPWVQPPGGPISFPSEMAQLDAMVASLDTLLWTSSQSNNVDAAKQIVQRCNQPLQTPAKIPDAKTLRLKDGFAANLFASEVNFPVEKPVKFTFDSKGRMWVATMSSYPQYYPGCEPNDKIVILEDTNNDGKADKHTVFADSLYMPLSFELGYGGVFVSQPPNLMFLQDTDGDDKADKREYLLHGFGTEDVHHSINAFSWGQDGALYMHSGTFLHTQVETPYGPVRNAYGETYRYEPRTMKLETHVSYPYANPWGTVFMRDGSLIIGDVSTGMNYYATPLTTATKFPFKHTPMKDFLTVSPKPKTCGVEIVSSRHFPDDMQGNVLFNTFIGFQGITNHRMYPKESGIEATREQPLLQSTDPNFRPVDLQFGPDGALYVADWYNPIINHGERALRDPDRDRSHGRIWRISYPGRPLLTHSNLEKQTVNQLLDQLRTYEDRARYRARSRLTDLPEKDVLDGLNKWLSTINSNEKDAERLKLEALWIYQQLHSPNDQLLTSLLKSNDPDIKSAATRVLFRWKDNFSWALDSLAALATDKSPKVRLNAIVSLSHFEDPKALNALLDAAELTGDDYINYALQQAFRHLAPVWKKMFDDDSKFLSNEPRKADALLSSLKDSTALKLPSFLEPDPAKAFYERRALNSADFAKWKNVPAVQQWLAQTEVAPTGLKKYGSGAVLRLSTVAGKMAYDVTELTATAGDSVTLVFNNSDDMAHNVVIGSIGAETKIGEAADKMAQLPDGYEKNFVPELKEVLFATPLIPAGETFELRFRAPSVAGEYPFLCTFPGHWRIMKGIFKVTKKG